MTRDEYNKLFHKVGLNRVAFKAVNDCDDEILVLVNEVIAAEREACLAACRIYLNAEEPYAGFQNGVECCIAAIQNHEEFLAHMIKIGKL